MSLYTVEQVELMRRLRLTGITSQQIIDAFDTLDRLERELAPFQNPIPVGDGVNPEPVQAPIPPPSFLGSNHITAIKTLASPYESLLNRYQRNQSGTPSSQSHIVGSNGYLSRRKRSNPNLPLPIFNQSSHEENGQLSEHADVGEMKEQNSEGHIWGVNSELNDSNTEILVEDQSFLHRSMPDLELLDTTGSPGHGHDRSLMAIKIRRRRTESRPRVIRAAPPPMAYDYSQLVDDQQLEEFMSRGEMEILKEIKDFVAARQLRQQTIAIMTGVSQPYVSRFLSGTGRELSSRVRRNMYRWYLAIRNNPDLLTTQESVSNVADESGPPTMVSISNSIFPSVNHIQSQHGQSPFSSSIYASPHGSLIRHSSQASSPGKDAIKRERFIFKPVHVRLLHKYFATDPYPSIKKREEIATACNKAYEHMDGCKLVPPREVVNSQVVGNWFSNRRKEKKRRGEMKLRRIRGAPRFGSIRRVENRTLSMPTLTAYREQPSTSGLSLSNLVPESTGETSFGSDTSSKRTDLVNIVNGLHAMNNGVLVLGDADGEEEGHPRGSE